MRTALTRCFLLLALCTLPSTGTAQAVETLAPAQDGLSRARAAILEIGERFASLRWRASEDNVLHGEDERGVRVDTPDASFDPKGWLADGSENVGMPYSWGGFTSLEEFELGLNAKLYAGNVPMSERAWSSQAAMGVDCSGFVSHCWNLPQKQSTRSLGALSYELGSYDELEPGDILNKFDSHVVLFKSFEGDGRSTLRVLEAARLRVEESVYTRKQLERSGFVPMRYKPLDSRWVSMSTDRLGAGALKTDSKAPRFLSSEGEREIPLEELPNPLQDAKPLDWARYSSSDEPGAEVTWMIAHESEGEAHAQRLFRVREKELASGTRWRTDAPFIDALVDFADFSNPHRDMHVLTSLVEVGHVRIGDRELPCHRISAVVEGSLLIRSKLFPLAVEMECLVSSEVPALGVVDARFDVTVTWDTDEDGEPVISREAKHYSLLAAGSAKEATGSR